MKRPRAPLLDSLNSTRALLHNQQTNLAQEVIQNAIDQIKTSNQWQQIKTIFDEFPFLVQSWQDIYCQTLTGIRNTNAILEFTKTMPTDQTTAICLLERAWALLQVENYSAAQQILLQVIPHLSSDRLGVAHKRLGLAQFHLQLNWQNHFEQAASLLSGRLLGLTLIDHAWCAQQSGKLDSANTLLTQALPKLRGDQYHLAWARYNLGEITIRTMNPDAERHYLEAEKLSRQSEAKSFRSRALQGIAKWRRYNQDFTRAEAAYRQAIETAIEDNDLRAAYWSLGRTLRLQHRYQEALETLEHARQVQATTGIEIEIAACQLALGRFQDFKSALHEPYRSIGLILRAEFARQNKNGAMALELLAQVDFSSLNAKEEIRIWIDLRTFASLAGIVIPSASQPQQVNTVEVQACGVLQVVVNRSKIALKPTGRIGELLVLLLELGGFAHVEKIIENLYPTEKEAKNKKSAVWDLVKRLRLALGWKDSILVLGNTIQLETSTNWIYDVSLARDSKTPRAFLEGVRSDWALDVALELGTLGLETRERYLN